jgi:cytochrome c556
MKRFDAGCARFLLASLLLVGTACEQPASRTDQAPEAAVTPRGSPSPASGSDTREEGSNEHAGEAHAADGHDAAGATGQALLPIMRGLGSSMTTLTHALMTDDYEGVTRSAAAVAEHAPISAGELERIRRVLGPEMAAFEAADESVHVASVRLRDAARERRLDRVVERLGDVQRGCVSCHAQFRERLRTQPAAR